MQRQRQYVEWFITWFMVLSPAWHICSVLQAATWPRPPPAHEVWSCCGVSVLNFATVPWPLLAGGWWLGGGMCVGAQNRLLLLQCSQHQQYRAVVPRHEPSIAPAVNQPVGCRCSHQQAAAQLTLHTAPGHNTHITTTTNNIVIVSSE